MIEVIVQNKERIQAIANELLDRLKISNFQRRILDQLPALIYLKDKEDNIIFMNKYGADLIGTTPEEMAGKGWQNNKDSEVDISQYFRNDLDIFWTGEVKDFMRPMVSDHKRIFHIVKSPLYIDGEIEGILAIATEIPIKCSTCGDYPRVS